ncbi:DNA ligase, phage-associated [Hyphomicrobium sulfonivorans]|uniref:DNA ligase, phage-associated n=1 Tax=Hyphomicrobium sulfonivorans TaxID=121290 RepID=A0A125NWB1_HYPSL|nr:hypothetical protein [Hyphomicrobium sulfonivorans]KWT72359.1 DNA ligase, phage-associated [Hyphomicrobium sulfonivorans]
MTFRPMLAVAAPAIETLRYPLLASPKLDGIRCVIRDGLPVTRNLKPVPNKHIAATLKSAPEGLDGELIVGAPVGADVMNRTASGVMSAEGSPAFSFHVFDCVAEGSFSRRLARAGFAADMLGHPFTAVTHTLVRDAASLGVFEESCVTQGYEGVMLRDPEGPYKLGRSTAREGFLLKLKRFQDAEATIVGFVERFHNGNEARINALGLTERSTHKAHKTPTGTLGALVLQQGDVRFEVGTGFDDALRHQLWAERESLPGRCVKFKFQQLTPDGVPRFPVFLGFRSAADL